MQMNVQTLNTKNFRELYYRNEERFNIAFFIGGFIFDILMMGRIDSWETIGQQIVYLVLIFAVLMHMFFETRVPRLEKLGRVKRFYFEYRLAIVHFFFGSLLNMYAIFFFKSSSLLTSFGFMFILVALLVANESHKFKKMGLPIKFGMFSLCLLAFSACVVPIFVGYIGKVVFLLSLFVGSLPLIATSWWVLSRRPDMFEQAKSQILLPMICVMITLLGLYFFRLIPPVPLSIPFIGVYHEIEKTPEGYRMAHERPWWRLWQNGDQEFVAQKTDKIYVAFRVFSPTRFSDQVLMRWYWKDHRAGWIMQDSIPIRIVGGRQDGFRGFGAKSNYQPGEWKVQVETTDNREIGRVYFNLQISEEQPRSFEYDLM
jgi:hypothetical protein